MKSKDLLPNQCSGLVTMAIVAMETVAMTNMGHKQADEELVSTHTVFQGL